MNFSTADLSILRRVTRPRMGLDHYNSPSTATLERFERNGLVLREAQLGTDPNHPEFKWFATEAAFAIMTAEVEARLLRDLEAMNAAAQKDRQF